jgi:caffeoyl-CoA O-methyltransferase
MAPDSEAVEAYANAHVTPHDDLLERLARETETATSSPQMMSSPVSGRLLEMLVFASRARNVLEVGTFTGYSALSMAAALPDGGRILTCEVDEHHASIARRYFAESGHGPSIDLRLGPALETIEAEPGPWDFAFIDADKTGYVDYYEAIVEKLAPRGLIALDNTLRSGRVADPGDESDAARVMREVNDHVLADPRTVSVLLTVRDGITLVRLAHED